MRRAQRDGATDAGSQRAFGKADDMYLFGLLCAYIVFVSLSAPGSIDLPTLQRLVEVTFRNDFSGLRCAARATAPVTALHAGSSSSRVQSCVLVLSSARPSLPRHQRSFCYYYYY